MVQQGGHRFLASSREGARLVEELATGNLSHGERRAALRSGAGMMCLPQALTSSFPVFALAADAVYSERLRISRLHRRDEGASGARGRLL